MPSAFETDALTHLDSLYGTALRLTRNEADAQTVVKQIHDGGGRAAVAQADFSDATAIDDLIQRSRHT